VSAGQQLVECIVLRTVCCVVGVSHFFGVRVLCRNWRGALGFSGGGGSSVEQRDDGGEMTAKR
jgi:hypothetical protein